MVNRCGRGNRQALEDISLIDGGWRKFGAIVFLLSSVVESICGNLWR
jgi:hypothetical protein